MKKGIVPIIFRIIGILMFAAAAIAFVLPMTANVINLGNLVGLSISLLLMAILIFWKTTCRWICVIRQKKGGRIFLIVVSVLCAIVLVTALALTALMIVGAHKTTDKDTTVVVLGCAVNGDQPSRMLRARLDEAYAYLVEHPQAVAVLTGGLGTGDTITESECMYRYLTEKGISPDRLYKEERSTTTQENLLYTKEIVQEKGLCADLLLVTNEFHEYRAIQIAKKLGMQAYALPAKSAPMLLLTYYVRELFAILYEWAS